MNRRTWITLLAAAVALLLLRACPRKEKVTYPTEEVEIKTYVDTTVYTIVDTQFIAIEKRINKAVQTATERKEVAVQKMEVLQAKLIEVETTKLQLVYDTVEVQVQPDSVMIYNVFEYAKTYGDETYIHRDTIQSRKVSREYVQKYIIK
jgi:hypothetical protein